MLVLALIAGGALALRKRGMSAAADSAPLTAVVARGNIEEVVNATGNGVTEWQATLTFASSGAMAEVLVEAGEQVEAGQVLARLETETAEWQVARSQASLDTAGTWLEQARQPANGEDHVSMGAAAACQARQVAASVERILALELFAAGRCRGIVRC